MGKSTKHGGIKENISNIIYGGLQLGKSRTMKVFTAWSFIIELNGGRCGCASKPCLMTPEG